MPTTTSNSRSGGSSRLYRYAVTLLVGFVLGQYLSSDPARLGRRLDDATTTTTTHDKNHQASPPLLLLAEQRQPKLADGCFHVFLDVGANIGVTGRFLLEPDQYPQAKAALHFFDQFLGPQRDNRDICVFSFEPNPHHYPRLHAVRQAYQAMGWRWHVVQAGVSDEAGEMTFYPRNDEQFSEWGFSAIKVPTPPHIGFAASGPLQIPVVSLAQWMQQHVQDRQLPDTVYGNYSLAAPRRHINTTTASFTPPPPQPKVLLKMDIEGMEYRVWPDLLLSGIFCQEIDAVFGEVHDQFFPQRLANGDVLHQAEGKAYWRQLRRAWKVNPSCRGRFVSGDDEHYLLDGIPLPKPPTK